MLLVIQIFIKDKNISFSPRPYWFSKSSLYFYLFCASILYKFLYSQSKYTMIKVGFSTSKKLCFIWFNDSHLKMMKNNFYFILKAFFVLKIFTFLSWLFDDWKNDLIRRVRSISKVLRHNLVSKQLWYTYCPLFREVKTTSQWNLVSYPSNLNRRVRSISKVLRHNLVNKQLWYTYCPLSREVKTTGQWNLVS